MKKRNVTKVLALGMAFSVSLGVCSQIFASSGVPNTGYSKEQLIDVLNDNVVESTRDLITDGITSESGGYYEAVKIAVEAAVDPKVYDFLKDNVTDEQIIEGLILNQIITSVNNDEYDAAIDLAVEGYLDQSTAMDSVEDSINGMKNWQWALISNVVSITSIDKILNELGETLPGASSFLPADVENTLANDLLSSLDIDQIINDEIDNILANINSANDAKASAFEAKAKALIADELKGKVSDIQSEIEAFVRDGVVLPEETIEVLKVLAKSEALADTELGAYLKTLEFALSIGGDFLLTTLEKGIEDEILNQISEYINLEDGAFDGEINELVNDMFTETGLDALITGDNWDYIAENFGVDSADEIDAMTLDSLQAGINKILADTNVEQTLNDKLSNLSDYITENAKVLEEKIYEQAKLFIRGEMVKLYDLIVDTIINSGIIEEVVGTKEEIEDIIADTKALINNVIIALGNAEDDLIGKLQDLSVKLENAKDDLTEKFEEVKDEIKDEIENTPNAGDLVDSNIEVVADEVANLEIGELIEIKTVDALINELFKVDGVDLISLTDLIGTLKPVFKTSSDGVVLTQNGTSATLTANDENVETKAIVEYGYDLTEYKNVIDVINKLLAFKDKPQIPLFINLKDFNVTFTAVEVEPEKAVFTVTYKNGDALVEETTVEEGAGLTITNTVLVNADADYVFDGWYRLINGIPEVDTFGNPVIYTAGDLIADASENMTFSANWNYIGVEDGGGNTTRPREDEEDGGDTQIEDQDPPLLETPEIETPEVETPEVETHEVETPVVEPTIEIPEEEVPLASIPDEQIPLGATPQTSDSNNFMLFVACALGFLSTATAFVFGRKKEQE